MITGVNGHSVDCIKHCGMPVNPHIEARLYTKESNTLVFVAGDARNHSHGNRHRRRRRRWCSRRLRCRTLTHFRCKGNMVDRVPQIEEDASPAVGKSAMMVFAADRAAAGVTVNVPA
jgi:hypothetical protein